MAEPFIGVQLGPHSVYDEGVDHVFDTLQRTARVNAVFIYSQSLQIHDRSWVHRQREEFADHGVPFVDPSRPNMARVWVHTHDEYYGGTFLRQPQDPSRVYGDVDVLDDVMEAAEKRGIQVFPRILEGSRYNDLIPNFPKILAVDVFGRRAPITCLTNPDYTNWWLSVIEDLIKSHPKVAGLKFGQERRGPLGNLLTEGTVPYCFCEHCRKRGREQGINVDRAIRGYQMLYEYVQNCLNDGPRPIDGYFVTFLRILLKYPEILAWEQMWFDSREDHRRQIYGTVKAIDPTKQVGWHIYHVNSWSPLFRAEMDYSSVKNYSDWIKPVVYHDCAGYRLKARFLDRLSKTIFRDVDQKTALNFLYGVLQYDPAQEPTLEDLQTEPIRGFSPDYVYREVKRCVEGVGPNVPVYAGIGFNVPTGGHGATSTPESAYEVTKRSFEAGAKGLVISREYDEMTLDNLSAVGRAVDELPKDF